MIDDEWVIRTGPHKKITEYFNRQRGRTMCDNKLKEIDYEAYIDLLAADLAKATKEIETLEMRNANQIDQIIVLNRRINNHELWFLGIIIVTVVILLYKLVQWLS
jgi:hypothetical protein